MLKYSMCSKYSTHFDLFLQVLGNFGMFLTELNLKKQVLD